MKTPSSSTHYHSLPLLLVLLLLAALSPCVLCQFPVPGPSYGGFRLGRVREDRAQVSFEVFIDPACIDTRDFFRDTFPAMYERYWSSNSSSNSKSSDDNKSSDDSDIVVGRVHFMPLPYHIASFEQTKASLWVMDTHPARYVPYLVANFRNFDHVANPVTQHMTLAEVRRQIFQYTVLPAGITDYDAYSAAMDRRDLWERARTTFKYAVSRGPFGTPAFFVNGVQLVTSDMSFEYFDRLFKSLLANK